MENIALLVSLEGTSKRVTTDWRSLAATLKQRGLGDCALQQLHIELLAGLIVSTRGLTLCKKLSLPIPDDMDWHLLGTSHAAAEQATMAGL
ncbi:hypothetical protein KDN34_03695 [Shewanella yunxiaonensis]|uniref:Uncharacterized protein n=1 Tax=Shewanella yunxiaonensis TaxID=2829809 RepID=A0ABX7YW57_9GAMM|nr:hypothetical protein [Shewanella yunxiaonensis]QUN06571.1 hypothetical protein KDN34_03695 [Shewanella yunxiaonensis]